jgi:hypothetical protein
MGLGSPLKPREALLTGSPALLVPSHGPPRPSGDRAIRTGPTRPQPRAVLPSPNAQGRRARASRPQSARSRPRAGSGLRTADLSLGEPALQRSLADPSALSGHGLRATGVELALKPLAQLSGQQARAGHGADSGGLGGLGGDFRRHFSSRRGGNHSGRERGQGAPWPIPASPRRVRPGGAGQRREQASPRRISERWPSAASG